MPDGRALLYNAIVISLKLDWLSASSVTFTKNTAKLVPSVIPDGQRAMP